MKKLLFALTLALPLFCLAQTYPHTVTTIDGKSYSGEIESYLGKKVVFTKTIPELGERSIPVEDIARIDGYIKTTRKKAITKGNPSIVFHDPAIDNQQESIASSSYKYMELNNDPSSDLITASALRLTGAVVGFGSLALSFGGAFDDMDPDTYKTVMTVSMASAAVCFIIGEVTLIGATKKMNKDAVTLTGANSGVGLAINF